MFAYILYFRVLEQVVAQWVLLPLPSPATSLAPGPSSDEPPRKINSKLKMLTPMTAHYHNTYMEITLGGHTIYFIIVGMTLKEISLYANI